MGVDCLILLIRLLRELDILSMVELEVFSEVVTGVVSKLTVLVTGLNATFAMGGVYCRIGRLRIGVDANAMFLSSRFIFLNSQLHLGTMGLDSGITQLDFI